MFFLYKIKFLLLSIFFILISLFPLRINAQEFEFKILGNENLDKEFIESIIVIDISKYSNDD